MSEPATSTRRGALLLVTLLLGGGALVAVPSSASGSASSAERWAGYRIARTGNAAGGWIGGYKIGGTPVFLITPAREPNHRGFRGAHLVDDLRGRHGPTRAETARAAWILSKYGGYRDAAQAAAVDASVYALLAGDSWRPVGARGAHRIQQAPQRGTVRRFARIMLDQSRRHAGRYHALVTATNADEGGTIAATVRVTDGHGKPAAGLPVTVKSGGGSVDAVTADNGRAVARFAASKAGWRPIIVRVHQVPDHRLHVRPPVRAGQAAAAEGGDRRTLVARTRAAVRGPQSLDLQASPGTVLVGGSAQVRASVEGAGAERSASGKLHGPYDSSSAAKCKGATVGTVSAKVRNGDYVLPALRPRKPGYYAWRVDVDGSPVAMPAAACGAVTKVKAVAEVSVSALQEEIAPGNAEVWVGLSGLPRYPAVDVTLTVWGPYASKSALTTGGCSGAIAASLQQTMNGDALVTLYPYLDEVGWYALQATVAAGELRQGTQSQCLASGTVLHVS
jgi:hypothetical protein